MKVTALKYRLLSLLLLVAFGLYNVQMGYAAVVKQVKTERKADAKKKKSEEQSGQQEAVITASSIEAVFTPLQFDASGDLFILQDDPFLVLEQDYYTYNDGLPESTYMDKLLSSAICVNAP